MKPCDCKDQQDVEKLNEQGFRINNTAISVEPLSVILHLHGLLILKIPQKRFEQFARWYLADQSPKSSDDTQTV
ncbi:hypothetical protein KA005_35845 [bacterium]|nr:hypothetical protein [bacterium]